MKRSKVFLGVTTALLGIAAFAAAKTAKFGTPTEAYYSNGSGACIVDAQRQFFTKVLDASSKPATLGDINATPLYSFNASCNSASRLYTKAD